MKWTSDHDADILVYILQNCEVKVPYAGLAAHLGCTPKALSHRMANIRQRALESRANAAGDGNGSTSNTGAGDDNDDEEENPAPKKRKRAPPKKKAATAKAAKKAPAKKSTKVKVEDEHEDEAGEEGFDSLAMEMSEFED